MADFNDGDHGGLVGRDRYESPSSPSHTRRGRRITRATICFLTDWMDGNWMSHGPNNDKHCPRWHGWLQLAWFKAHNSRLYRWADEWGVL